MSEQKKTTYKKIAMALSLCAIVLWTLLGTGTSLAWFTDTSETVKNVINFAEFDLVVSYKQPDGSYKEITGESPIFDDNALYEPGYVQVVYLKVENKGDVPFDFKTAVNVTDYTTATNVFGQQFLLQEYLRFGLVTAPTEPEMLAQVADRDKAMLVADMPLNTYETDTLQALGAGKEAYMALVVCMPDSVNNVANYRGDDVPRVELGIIVTAQQQTN